MTIHIPDRKGTIAKVIMRHPIQSAPITRDKTKGAEKMAPYHSMRKVII